MSQLHVPKPVPPNHLPSLDEVPKIKVFKPIVLNSLALSPFGDFSKKGIREEAVSPVKLVFVGVEGDSGNNRLTREASGARWFGSLLTPRTGSRSTGQRITRSREEAVFPMDVAKTIRRSVERYAYSWLG